MQRWRRLHTRRQASLAKGKKEGGFRGTRRHHYLLAEIYSRIVIFPLISCAYSSSWLSFCTFIDSTNSRSKNNCWISCFIILFFNTTNLRRRKARSQPYFTPRTHLQQPKIALNRLS